VTGLLLTAALAGCKPKQRSESNNQGSGSAAGSGSAEVATKASNCVPAKTWTPISTDKAPPIKGTISVKLDGDKWLWFGPTGTLPNKYAGGIYDACTNTWAPATGDGIPDALSRPAITIGSERRDVEATKELAPIVAGSYVVWLFPGAEMSPGTGTPNTDKQDDDSPLVSKIAGAIYDVAKQKWTEIPLAGPLAQPRVAPSVWWTGKEVLVFGGAHEFKDGPRTNSKLIADGAAIDPATGAVRALATAGAPTARANAAAVWTGTHMFIWGGCGTIAQARTLLHCDPLADGALYDPVANTWKPVSSKDAPHPRVNNTAAMAAGKVVVFRGRERADDETNNKDTTKFENAYYDVATDTWTQLPAKDVVGDRVIGDHLFAMTQKFDGTDSARIYKIGSKGEWRDASLEPSDAWLERPDLGISFKALTAGDSMVPHAPTAAARFDAASGTWKSTPIADLPYPLFTDAGVPDLPNKFTTAGDRYIAWKALASEAPPAPCPKKKCESWETAQYNLLLQGWIIDL